MDSIGLNICSSDKFKNSNLSNSLIVTINKRIVLGDYNIPFLIKDEIDDNQWIITSEDVDAAYVAFLLNDPMTLRVLFGGKIIKGKVYNVTKSMLSSVKFPMSSASISTYYSIIELLFQKIYLTHPQDDLEKLKLDVLSSIRLALSFEIHNYKLMSEINIKIFENWKAIVDLYRDDINVIFQDLMNPSNELMSNVKRFQLFLNFMKNKITNGLETE